MYVFHDIVTARAFEESEMLSKTVLRSTLVYNHVHNVCSYAYV